MNRKTKIKAHDILSDENFTAESLSDKYADKTDEKEIQMAGIIYSFLTSEKEVVRCKEKEQTERRIKQSIQSSHHRNWKRITKWAVAASVMFVVFSVMLLKHELNETSNIADFGKSLNIAESDSVINLLLQDGRKVVIDRKESEIAYDLNGENITIDSEQKITQEIKQEKQVFNTLMVPYGKRTQITLSDGSHVWLNSGSKLVYPANINEKREVYIEGEAVFEVTSSEQKPFVVVTKDFEIKVLGTIFNVCAYPEDEKSSTVLAKGRIELTSTEKSLFSREKLTILPGTMAVYDSGEGTFNQQQVNAVNYMSWRDGYFIFKNEPLVNILKKLERYYNIDIVLSSPDLEKEEFSGNLNLRNTTEEVLSVIAETTPFSVINESEKLIIRQD